MEPIPGAALCAEAIGMLLNAWDAAVLERGGRPVDGSHAWFDEGIGADRAALPRKLALMPRELMFLTGGSVMQVARSAAALFGVSDRWGLTLGHLPLVRSVLEGAGQVAWLVSGDGPFGGPPQLSDHEAVLATTDRAARSALLWTSCLQQARFDYRLQGETAAADQAARQLVAWETVTREMFPRLLIDTKRNDRWSINGVKVPGFGEMADKGLRLAWWPDEPGADLYPWLSAATHHRLYPFMHALKASEIDGKPVLSTMPPPSEVAAGGLAVAWAVMRLCNLAFAHLGWPIEALNLSVPLLATVNQRVHDATDAEAAVG